jgi:amidase
LSEIAFWPAKKLAGALRRRKIGALELLEHYVERIERYNGEINAVTGMALDLARKRARAADRALARGAAAGALFGVPMTVKEAFAALDLPTTWGIPQFRDNRPPKTALAVERLMAAGAVPFGKTNVPIWLADWQSYNDIYGTTRNPWDVARSPGGSSGGSAAALAAGLTGLELGSDIGGSIRVPAHFCGVYGHKPTYGLCAPTGHALGDWAAFPDIAVIGPMARSADDLDLALAAIAGPDPASDGALEGGRVPAPRKSELRAFKLAVMLDHPLAPVDRELQDALQKLVDFLAKRRVKLDLKARPALDWGESFRVYQTLLHAALSAAQNEEQFEQNRQTAKALAPDDDSYRARFYRGVTLDHRAWLRLNEQRHHLRRAWARFFADYDLLLCPPATCAAFPHDHRDWSQRFIAINGERRPMEDIVFWAGQFGIAHLPATVAPIGFTAAGLPIGVQIVGPHLGDRTCIAFARLIEREYHAFLPPPGYR